MMLSRTGSVRGQVDTQGEPEDGLLDTCRELGVGFVPYSPLGRGFLTGAFSSPEAFDKGDFRLANPRFQPDAFEANLSIVTAVRTIAEQKGATAAQIALAWLLAKDPDLVPIPGTRKISRLEENLGALSLTLSDGDLQRIEAAVPSGAAVGERYTAEGMKGVNV